jgi:cell fate regulator YaaT (PSP1 superfamily)
MARTVLVRYGAISEVARFESAAHEPISRGSTVVVRTHRGLEIGLLLEDAPPAAEGGDESTTLVRAASPEDVARGAELQSRCRHEYDQWHERIRGWNLEIELLDLERTLDGEKLILYVLNGRGSDCTRLALHAAAAGLGIVEVQPVSSEGLVTASAGGGCGSGGCGTCST